VALDYTQLYDRINSSDTAKRLSIAIRLKAFSIRDEDKETPKHDLRIRWAEYVIRQDLNSNGTFIREVLSEGTGIQKFYQDNLTDADYLDIADKIANKMRV
jgi:hypothetical protein